jgi:hypothetical protein
MTAQHDATSEGGFGGIGEAFSLGVVNSLDVTYAPIHDDNLVTGVKRP